MAIVIFAKYRKFYLRKETIVNVCRLLRSKKPPSKEKLDDKALEKEIAKLGIEEPTTCCMSGCSNCVWVDFAEQVLARLKDADEPLRKYIIQKVSDPSMRAYLDMELRLLQKEKNSKK